MTLYKMELYKTLHRPVVWISGLLMAGLLVLYFVGLMEEEHSLAEGKTRFGYAAIQHNREITKEYEGILTDEKLRRIVDEYGFPSEVVKDFPGWLDENYLTAYAVDYFSDGYMRGWGEGEYKVAENLIPIAESELYEVMGGRDIPFGYGNGWIQYIEFLQFAGWALIAWLVIVLSPLFAQEHDARMYPLLFTTEHGREKDVYAKILAALTVTLVSFLAITGSAFLACCAIYGTGGAQMMWGQGSFYWRLPYRYTMVQFVSCYTLMYLFALLMTFGYCVLASSGAESGFEALLTTGGLLIAPLIMRIFNFGSSLLYFLCDAQPIFLVWAISLEEVLHSVPVWLCVWTSAAATVICTFAGLFKWKKLRDYS